MLSVELAFRRAWQHWPYNSHFPAVRVDIHRNDLLGIISRSPRRRSPRLAGWSSEWPFVPYVDGNWDLNDIAKVIAPEARVPLAGWQDLAQVFLDRLAGVEEPSR